MVKDIAVRAGGHGRAASEAMTLERHSVAQDPTRAIEIVHKGLHHVVTRQPAEAVLRSELPLQFVQAGLALRNTVGCTEKIFFDGDDVADGTVMNALDGFSVTGVVTAVETGDDAEVLFICNIA